MWRRILFLSVALAPFLPAEILIAQDASAPPGKESWRLQQYVRLQIVSGRIAVTQADAWQSRTVTAGDSEAPYRRQLQLSVTPPSCVVQYESVDPSGALTLKLCERGKLTIQREYPPEKKLPRVVYSQIPGGDVRLAVGNEKPVVYSSRSLWQLLLTQQAASREHLVPLLEALRPDWNLAAQVQEVEASLLAAALLDDPATEAKEWQRLVDQLAARDFRTRQRADAALRSGGIPAASWLSRLDRQGQSGEQRARIDAICKSLCHATSDTPERAAAWLLSDPPVWLALLSSEKETCRAAAADQLSEILGQDVTFSPLAAASERQQQIAGIKRRFGLQ